MSELDDLSFTQVNRFLVNLIEDIHIDLLREDRDNKDLDATFERIWDESRVAFDDWFNEQADTIVDLMKDAAPARTGNLSAAIHATPEGDSWSFDVNDVIAPYWRFVEEGRGPISSAGVIRFAESRQRWTEGGNFGRNAQGPGSRRYPYEGNLKGEGKPWWFGEDANLRDGWSSVIGPAPAIPFRQTGFDDYELRGHEAAAVDQITAEIIAIIVSNGAIPTS